nr:hypothetical protein CFP56_45537 [Quercus suber]
MQDIPTKSKESKHFPDLDFHSCFTKNHSSRISKKDPSFFFLQSSTSPSHPTTQFRLHSLTPKKELSAIPSNSEVHALKAKGKEQ